MKKIYFLTCLLVGGTLASFGQNKFKNPPRANQPSTPITIPHTTTDASLQTGRNTFQAVSVKLEALGEAVQVVRDTTDGRVIFIENLAPAPPANARLAAAQIAQSFLEEHKLTLGLKNPMQELQLVTTETENGRTHQRMQQHLNNVPIYGGDLIVHLQGSRVSSVNGKSFATPTISTTPQLTAAQAIERAMKDVGQTSPLQATSFFALKNEATLIIYPVGKTYKLAYELTIRPNTLERWVYFVDAQTGQVLDKFSHTCTLEGVFKTTAKDLNNRTQEIRIYEKNGVYYLIDASLPTFDRNRSQMPDNPVGAIWTIDAKNSRIGDNSSMNFSHVANQDGTSWSPVAVSAHVNATTCYHYYANTFQRQSLNGSGGTIVSVINIADEDGNGMDNAYWNGEFIGYGNGRTGFKPLAGALDVAGHEMTHGVIENTAKLEYRNQSGALNESFADIFATMIDRDDWLLGEDIVKPTSFPSGALRSLENPNQGGTSLQSRGYQPKNMSQYVNLPNTPEGDNGGVHVNSGITNHAFYLFAVNSAVEKDKAERVYYQALTKYLTRTSKFIDLRLAVIQSAKDLYGDGAVSKAAADAFDAVGIGTSSGTNTPTTENKDLPVNPGQESLVVYDPVEETLYVGPYVTNGQFSPFAERYGCLNKPSITDDGKTLYFIGKDKHIYQKNLTTTAAPVKLSQDPSWRNVAVSKDGKRLAAVTSAYDQFIYIFNIEAMNNITVNKFKLYNPTYTQGVSTGEVKYADSFEWDYKGETLVYDAFNSVASNFGGSYDYWDVGVLQAWDPVKKNFGTGTIEKLFTNLEEGENIGNPTYAKTNAGIMAFDYVIFGNNPNATTDDQYNVIAVDFTKPANQGIKLVVKNNDISYPDYSKADKIIVYNATENGKSVVKQIGMATDKISPSGSASTLFTDAKWAVWFAQGTRQLPTKQEQQFNISPINDQQPNSSFTIQATASSNLPVQISVKSGNATVNGTTVNVGSTPGKVVLVVSQAGNDQFSAASTEVSFCIQPPTPTLSLSGTTLTASNGQLYQWYLNGTAVGTPTSAATRTATAGTYTVKTVTSDGCLSAASNAVNIQATQNQTLNVPSNIPDQQPNGSFTIQATASSNLPVQITVKSGDATVSGSTVKLGSTPGKVVITISQAGNNEFKPVSTDLSFCIAPKTPTISLNSGFIIATGGGSGTLYQWYINGKELGGQTSDNRQQVVFAGTYSVRAITADGCLSALSNVIQPQVLSLPPDLDLTVTLTPNPTGSWMEVIAGNGLEVKQLDLFDVSGRWMKRLTPAASKISLADLPAGSYLLHVLTDKGTTTKRVIRD